MQLKQQNLAGSGHCSAFLPLLGALLGALGFVGGTLGQETSTSTSTTSSSTTTTTMPSPSEATSPGQTSVSPGYGVSQLAPTAPGFPAQGTEAVPQFLQWGPVQVRPHVDFQSYYADGLLVAPFHTVSSYVNVVAPGVLFQLGPHWTLDYTPSLWYYSSSFYQNTFNNYVKLTGATTYQDWVFGLIQSYGSYSQPLIETGAQTDQDIFTTDLTASYFMSSKLSLDLDVNQNFRYSSYVTAVPGQPLQDSLTWGTLDWLNYQFWPRFTAGIGVGGGYVDISPGSDMAFENLEGRVIWTVAEKLRFTLSGGLDYRQFINSTSGNTANPVFNLMAEDRLTDTTTVSVYGSQVVAPAYFSDQLSVYTIIGGTINQRLFQHLNLSLTGGYRWSSYSATTPGVFVNREDQGFFFTARLSAQLFKRATASIFVYTSDNNSNQPGYTYSSAQAGFELAYRF